MYPLQNADPKHQSLITGLSLAFPLHFVLLEDAACKLEETKAERSLTATVSEALKSDDARSIDGLRLGLKKLDVIRQRMRTNRENFLRIQLGETLLERVPQVRDRYKNSSKRSFY